MKSAALFLFSILTAAASAQQDLETARSQTVTGLVTDGSEALTLRLRPLDAGATAQTFDVTAAGDSFSHPLKLFPGGGGADYLDKVISERIATGIQDFEVLTAFMALAVFDRAEAARRWRPAVQ